MVAFGKRKFVSLSKLTKWKWKYETDPSKDTR